MADEESLDSTMQAALAAMNSGGESQTTSTEETTPGAAATPPPAPEPWEAMPKSWKKDYEPKWPTVDPEVRKYVHQREKEQLDGIMQYKTVADKWGNTVQPFQQWFDHYKVDPHEAFKRLANAHIVMKWGKPEDRKAYAQELVKDYELWDALGLQKPATAGANGAQVAVPPEVEALKSRVDYITQSLQTEEYNRNLQKVQTFFADPKNEFAEELQPDILKIIQLTRQAGQDISLEQAYEQAKWNSIPVRQKLFQRQLEEASKPGKGGTPNVKPSSAPANPTDGDGKDESLDDTLKATLSNIRKKAH